MCGRYNITDDPATRLLLEILGIELEPLPLINIAPTESAPVVLPGEAGNEVHWMRWWLVPSWSAGPSQKYAMFNARAETVATSRAFREPFRTRRAVAPASSFIEWSTRSGEKEPYRIEGAGQALAFAAVWDHWGDGEGAVQSFAILTRAATPAFSAWHARMPVLLDAQGIVTWMSRDTPTDALTALCEDEPPVALTATRLSRKVNNARNKAPEFLQGLESPIPVG